MTNTHQNSSQNDDAQGSSSQDGRPDDTAHDGDADADSAEGRNGPPVRQNPSWEYAIDCFIGRPELAENTVRTLENTLKTFYRDHVSWHITGPAGVEPHAVDRYVNRTTLSKAYRLSLYSRINSFYAWLVEEGFIDEADSPMSDVKRPEAPSSERDYLTPSEHVALVTAIRTDYEERVAQGGQAGIKESEIIWVLPPLRFGTATGLRPSVMKELKVGDVDFDEKTLQVPQTGKDATEGEVDRTIPLCPMALEVAEEAKTGKRDTDYLFRGARSEQIDTRRLSRTVKRYLREAKVRPDLNFTDCTRHTCASWMMTLGYTTLDLMQLFGYETIKSAEPYGHLAPSMEELRYEPSVYYRGFAEETTELGFYPPVFTIP
jgi:integrase